MSINILFVCVENAGRSQMAEAFFRKFAPKQYSVQSAGTVPSSELNEAVVSLMREIGVDMTGQRPKLLSRPMLDDSSTVVNMGCIDKESSCPMIYSENVPMINWSIPDPKGRSYDDVRKIRDQIKESILELIESLGAAR